MSLFRDLFSGPNAPFYQEYEDGPLVSRLGSRIATGAAAHEVENLRAALEALAEQEGTSDPRTICARLNAMSREQLKEADAAGRFDAHKRVSAAAERLLNTFARCDGYLADWTGGKNIA